MIAIGAGVIGGAVLTDWLIGGAMASSLINVVRGSGTAAVAQPRLYTPAQIREYRSAGAIIGEAIRPATEARDIPARNDLFRMTALALGGLVGWLTANHLYAQ